MASPEAACVNKENTPPPRASTPPVSPTRRGLLASPASQGKADGLPSLRAFGVGLSPTFQVAQDDISCARELQSPARSDTSFGRPPALAPEESFIYNDSECAWECTDRREGHVVAAFDAACTPNALFLDDEADECQSPAEEGTSPAPALPEQDLLLPGTAPLTGAADSPQSIFAASLDTTPLCTDPQEQDAHTEGTADADGFSFPSVLPPPPPASTQLRPPSPVVMTPRAAPAPSFSSPPLQPLSLPPSPPPPPPPPPPPLSPLAIAHDAPSSPDVWSRPPASPEFFPEDPSSPQWGSARAATSGAQSSLRRLASSPAPDDLTARGFVSPIFNQLFEDEGGFEAASPGAQKGREAPQEHREEQEEEKPEPQLQEEPVSVPAEAPVPEPVPESQPPLPPVLADPPIVEGPLELAPAVEEAFEQPATTAAGAVTAAAHTVTNELTDATATAGAAVAMAAATDEPPTSEGPKSVHLESRCPAPAHGKHRSRSDSRSAHPHTSSRRGLATMAVTGVLTLGTAVAALLWLRWAVPQVHALGLPSAVCHLTGAYPLPGPGFFSLPPSTAPLYAFSSGHAAELAAQAQAQAEQQAAAAAEAEAAAALAAEAAAEAERALAAKLAAEEARAAAKAAAAAEAEAKRRAKVEAAAAAKLEVQRQKDAVEAAAREAAAAEAAAAEQAAAIEAAEREQAARDASAAADAARLATAAAARPAGAVKLAVSSMHARSSGIAQAALRLISEEDAGLLVWALAAVAAVLMAMGAAIRVRKTVPTEPKQPAGAGGNTAAAAADDVLFAGAGHDDDAAFGDPAEGAADVAGGGRHRHRRTSWSMAKEEAVTFILASPAATHGAPVRASVSPSEVIEPFTGTRAQATARKRPAEADSSAAVGTVAAASASSDAESLFVSPNKKQARGALFPTEATPLSTPATRRRKAAAAASAGGFASGTQSVAISPEQPATLRKSKRLSTAVNNGGAAAPASARASTRTRSSTPAYAMPIA